MQSLRLREITLAKRFEAHSGQSLTWTLDGTLWRKAIMQEDVEFEEVAAALPAALACAATALAALPGSGSGPAPPWGWRGPPRF